MPVRISFTNCACCGSSSVFPVLSAKDHTVSNEVFEIWHCDDCTIVLRRIFPAQMKLAPIINPLPMYLIQIPPKDLLTGYTILFVIIPFHQNENW